MAIIDHISLTEEFIVCHNGVDVFHFIHASSSELTSTGQPNLVVFATGAEAMAAWGNQINAYYAQFGISYDMNGSLVVDNSDN